MNLAKKINVHLLNKICKGWVEEYRFHPSRRWRFDFAHPGLLLAIEVDGSVWVAGRHTRGAGFIKDCEKINEAQMMGWKVLRYTPQQMREILRDVKRISKTKGGYEKIHHPAGHNGMESSGQSTGGMVQPDGGMVPQG